MRALRPWLALLVSAVAILHGMTMASLIHAGDLPPARFPVGASVCVPETLMALTDDGLIVVEAGVHEIRNIDWTWPIGADVSVYDLGAAGEIPTPVLDDPSVATPLLVRCGVT
jgi:hypothetical protein